MGVRGLFGQHSALAHAEAMLLVHHSQTQPGKLHALAQDGVGAHHKVGLVTADSSQRGAAGGGLHAAGQQGYTHSEGGQHPVQILCVLGGKDLGGGQQGRLVSAADAGPDGGGGNQRLAAAHIALQKAVHGGAAGQIGQNFVYGPALGTGGGEGERCPEGGRVEPLHGCTGGGAAPVLHSSNAQLEHQQLLVDEPPPGCKSLLLCGRAVDGPHGIGLGEQAVFFQHLLWQRVGQEFRMGEQLPDAFCDHGAGKPLGLGVNGLEGSGGDLCRRAHLRVDHLTAKHPAGHDALKIVFLPQLQLLGGIGIVEPGDLQAGNIIPGGDALHPPPARQDAPGRFGEHLGLHHALGVWRGLGNGVGTGKIDVTPGIVAEQIGQCHDAQLLEPLGGLGPHALEVAHRRVRGQGGVMFSGHGRRLLSWFSLF